VRQIPNGGLAAARNAGVAVACAPIVAFTDDDCEPEPGWLAALLAAFVDPRVGGVSGHVRSAPTNSLVLRYIEERRPLSPLPAELLRSRSLLYRLALYLRGTARLDPPLQPGAELYSVVGANMAFRTEVLDAVGGFDAAFRFGGEEEELSARVHGPPTDVLLVYEPDAVVVHHFERDLGDTLRRARAYGKGNARTALKHPHIRPIVFPFPLLIASVGLLAAARRSSRLAATTAVLPLLTYVGWTLTALRRRRPEALAYAYVQLAEEVATMAGEILGYRAGYEPAAESDRA
jgi:GT2 family glycosyltransferase